MNDITCKVCGQTYSDNLKNCPCCGCPQGATIPAYLRCKQCGTVLQSSNRRCPNCGQIISPQTASVVLLKDVRRNAARPSAPSQTAAAARQSHNATKKRMPRWAAWTLGIVAAIIVLTGEGLLVKTIYANVTYRECLDLWNSGGSVAANRRAPDPVYEDTTDDQAIDSLLDIDYAHNVDSVDHVQTTEETEADSLDY